jgi:uncharacterized protein (TIGR02598 family)
MFTKTKPKFNSAGRRHVMKRGFSLVEVLMAVGIVAVSVLTVVGLLPHGLEVSRKTGDLAYKTRMFQQIASEYQAMPWSVVTGAGAGKKRLKFDFQGGAIGTGPNEGFTTFVAEAEVVGTSVVLPSVGGSGDNDNLRFLVVRIATTGDPNFSFDDSKKSGSVAIYSSLLAKTN